jgi:UDP-glucose 4-epimerase
LAAEAGQRPGAAGTGPVLVTGGAGFIGSHLVHALLASHRSVRVLDDFSSGTPANLDGAVEAALAGGVGYELLVGDVRDDVVVRQAVAGCSAVAHLAACASVSRSLEDPVGSNSITHGGTVNVVRGAVAAGVPRLVLASSCAVYGDAARLPVTEDAPLRPLSPYAQAKRGAEQTCRAAADAGQLSAACLRFFNVYGPRQDPGSPYSGVISRFLDVAATGGVATVYGDGRQTRDFVYVADVVVALHRALDDLSPGCPLFNVGSGEQTTLLAILDTLEELCGRPVPRVFAPPRDGDIRHSRADTTRIAQALGWTARWTLAEGLAETLAWSLQRRTPARTAHA